MANSCIECGYPLTGNESACPECGCPVEIQPTASAEEAAEYSSHNATSTSEPITVTTTKTDWANYIYECGVIVWETFIHRYFTFYGRASRREFWSFVIIYGMCGFIAIQMAVAFLMIPFIASGSMSGLSVLHFLTAIAWSLPLIAVSVRRMHDIGKSGWWILVPFAHVFLYLKRSDAGDNEYGSPFPAHNILEQ